MADTDWNLHSKQLVTPTDEDRMLVEPSDETAKAVEVGGFREWIMNTALFNTLTTTAKNIIGAIEEIKGKVEDNTASLNDKANNVDNNRTTLDKTVTGAINEINAKATQKSTSLFNGAYITVNNEVITLMDNITNYNKISLNFGSGGLKTWNTVITHSDNYPKNYNLDQIITVTIANTNFTPMCVSFKITASNQLTVLDGAGANIRNIKGLI